MKIYNPTDNDLLSGILSNKEFKKLKSLGLLNYKLIREFRISQEFKELRKRMKTDQAIKFLQKIYPNFKEGTIRKIVYLHTTESRLDNLKFKRREND